MRDPDEARKKYETRFLLRQSKAQHAEDVRHNEPPKPWFFRKKDEAQHPSSAAFERRMRGDK